MKQTKWQKNIKSMLWPLPCPHWTGGMLLFSILESDPSSSILESDPSFLLVDIHLEKHFEWNKK